MVIPSIDLMDGRVVQLQQGKEKVIEQNNYLELAQKFNKYGEIAVIDIDAALNKGNNQEIIKKILPIAECRVGGGIRSVEKAHEFMVNGAKKIIVGSKAFENDSVNHEFLKELSHTIGRCNLIVAVDAVCGEVVTQGWRHKTSIHVTDAVKEIEDYASEILFTCVEKEGMLKGIDMEMVNTVNAATSANVCAAGGVHTLKEIKTLADMGINVQVGMAVYTQKIDLTEAFIESLTWKNRLIPTITQNETGQVLMLAYSTKESLRKCFETGFMWYYSRSRQSLWKKGGTSHNIQKIIQMRADCDRDALLATVAQTGVACHQQRYSCFGDKKFTLQQLYNVIQKRLTTASTGSYTRTLTDSLLKEKLQEEIQEIIDAEKRSDVIWEAADVLYFLTVYLAKHNIKVDDVLFELARRRRS